MSKIPSDTQWADLVYRIKEKANSSDLPTKVSDLTNDSGYQTASDVSSAISSAVSSVMTYKGTVATVADLPASGNKVGDVYNVTATGGNYAWDGTSWDELGSTVDLSNYYTKSQTDTALAAKADASTTYTKTEVDTALAGKASTADLASKADAATTYTKTEVDTALSGKANTSTTYTKTEVDTALSGKADVPAGGASYVTTADLATVATSGSYNDLSNKPTIPAAQIQSDWNQTTTTAKDYIKNKPTLATVATSGSYNDLSNKPTIPDTFTTNEWNALWA